MTSLEYQLVQERLAKQRHYVLANTRARWGFVGFGIVLLAAVKLAGLATISWWFILVFAASFAGANAGVRRLVQGAEFKPWYPQLNLIVGCLLISAVLLAMGPNGHILYGAYVIAPLQAAGVGRADHQPRRLHTGHRAVPGQRARVGLVALHPGEPGAGVRLRRARTDARADRRAPADRARRAR
ncbi:MAG: hypothetical protein DMD64_15425 [Gemmatimonadetes bacterium]|nr:MAG: hypothetical protein DMD64_15425 [Gemmatimonadota bacterium]